MEDLPRCAPARLLEETFRLIRGSVAAPSLKLLSALDALKVLLPPVDAYLKQNGKEGERTFYAFAEALDRRVASGEPLDDAILLATLLMPISRATPPPARVSGSQRAALGVPGHRGPARQLRAVGAAAPADRRAVPAAAAGAAHAHGRAAPPRWRVPQAPALRRGDDGVRALRGGHGRVPRGARGVEERGAASGASGGCWGAG